MTTTKSYDLLNRLTNIVTTNASGTVASFRYVYNSANQRTSVTNADSSYWVYTYDSLGQVVSGKKYWSDGTPVAGQQYTYGFDDIGNRKKTGAGGDQSGSNLRTANYGANSLNQYTNRDVPGYVSLVGTANSNSTVSISRSGYSTIWPSTRHGAYFWGEIPLDNTTGVVSATLNTLAVLNNGSNPDLVSSNSGNVLLQQTQETFLYDLDGNLIRDGLWTNTWDGENRLISMQSRTNVPGAARQKLDFTYDWMGRRIQKVVSIWGGSSWSPQYTNRFAYDGWNVIGILNETNGLVSAFAWGSDLSGSLQGAGGVGGLLLADIRTGTSASTNFVCFDGNGNVSALVSSTNSAVSAAYEYGPFGEVIRATGLTATANPFRYSTKYEDDEGGLLYYGYRYYSPSLGRWWSRDPMGERGGVNLACFAKNSPLRYWDGFGLCCGTCDAESGSNSSQTDSASCDGLCQGKLNWTDSDPQPVSTREEIQKDCPGGQPSCSGPSYTFSSKCEKCKKDCKWRIIYTVDATCKIYYADPTKMRVEYDQGLDRTLQHERCHCEDLKEALQGMIAFHESDYYETEEVCNSVRNSYDKGFDKRLADRMKSSRMHRRVKYQDPNNPCFAEGRFPKD
jgi:RHS repeat-associated protein